MNEKDILTRNDFHKIINKNSYKVGVEIGLGFGDNALYLLNNTRDDFVLTCIEDWSVRGFSQHKEETLFKLCDFDKRISVVESKAHEACRCFKDNSVDFLYIDGDHRYGNVLQDLEDWWPKVRKGGFVGGHDYVEAKACGVIRAVDEFFTKINRRSYFNLTLDRLKSFWIIK